MDHYGHEADWSEVERATALASSVLPKVNCCACQWRFGSGQGQWPRTELVQKWFGLMSGSQVLFANCVGSTQVDPPGTHAISRHTACSCHRHTSGTATCIGNGFSSLLLACYMAGSWRHLPLLGSRWPPQPCHGKSGPKQHDTTAAADATTATEQPRHWQAPTHTHGINGIPQEEHPGIQWHRPYPPGQCEPTSPAAS
jgi:hypothetical protein